MLFICNVILQMLTYFYIEHFYIYFCYLSASAIFLRLVEHFHFFRYKKICKKWASLNQCPPPLPSLTLIVVKLKKTTHWKREPSSSSITLLLYYIHYNNHVLKKFYYLKEVFCTIKLCFPLPVLTTPTPYYQPHPMIYSELFL